MLRRCPAPFPPSLGALSGDFWPLDTTGTIPRTDSQVSPRGFLVSSRGLGEPWSSSSARSLPSAPTWLRMGSPLPRTSQMFYFIAHLSRRGVLPFLRGCLAYVRVFSSLCGDAHSPCHRVGLTQYALRGYCILHHVQFDLSYESWAYSFSFVGQLVPVARRRHRRTLCRSSRITKKTRLCFEKHLKIMTVLLRQRNQEHWICHGDP